VRTIPGEESKVTNLDKLLLCEFRLAQPLQANAPSVGSRMNLELEVPQSNDGDSVATVRFTGRVVSVNDAPHSGWTNVVCQVDEMEPQPQESFNAAS
jgi:hypothetical protein